MKKFNPKKHHRRSIRLKDYDYSQEGLYFITICVQDQKHLFGEVLNGEMVLNDAGMVAYNCWLEIPVHFPNVVLHEFVIMPNHIHGIIEFVGAKNISLGVGAKNISPEGAKNISPVPLENDSLGVGAKNISPEGAKNISPIRGTSKTIGSVVRGFKIGVTKWFRQNTNVYNVWHRNYYEHIIRDEQAYQNISNYIINNPMNWSKDKFYK